jgi:transcriptional regulator with XRE-family HTH domain
MHTRIRYLRTRAGLTQDELAAAAEIGRSTVQSTESGKFPRPKSLRALAKALKCNIEDLYTEELKYADGNFNPSKPDDSSNRVAA